MASNTPNLNLYKKDPLTDGNDTFNIQTMLNDNWDKVDETAGEHISSTSNPHSVTAEQVGLGNVDNTADADKPVSTAQATAIAEAKKAGTDAAEALATHKNDKDNPHGVTAAQLGLGNVDNTADMDKPISNAVQAALNSVAARAGGQSTFQKLITGRFI